MRMAECWRKESRKKEKRNIERTGINGRRELKKSLKRGDEQTRKQEWRKRRRLEQREVIFLKTNIGEKQRYARQDNRTRRNKEDKEKRRVKTPKRVKKGRKK